MHSDLHSVASSPTRFFFLLFLSHSFHPFLFLLLPLSIAPVRTSSSRTEYTSYRVKLEPRTHLSYNCTCFHSFTHFTFFFSSAKGQQRRSKWKLSLHYSRFISYPLQVGSIFFSRHIFTGRLLLSKAVLLFVTFLCVLFPFHFLLRPLLLCTSLSCPFSFYSSFSLQLARSNNFSHFLLHLLQHLIPTPSLLSHSLTRLFTHLPNTYKLKCHNSPLSLSSSCIRSFGPEIRCVTIELILCTCSAINFSSSLPLTSSSVQIRSFSYVVLIWFFSTPLLSLSLSLSLSLWVLCHMLSLEKWVTEATSGQMMKEEESAKGDFYVSVT